MKWLINKLIGRYRPYFPKFKEKRFLAEIEEVFSLNTEEVYKLWQEDLQFHNKNRSKTLNSTQSQNHNLKIFSTYHGLALIWPKGIKWNQQSV